MSTTKPTTPQGRASRYVPNFTAADELKITAGYHSPETGALVSLIQNAGSLSFQHSMTAVIARELAAHLIALADFADALEFEADVMKSEVSL